MNLRRWMAALALAALALPMGTASAAPIDTWPVTHGIDCVNDPYNPLGPDGTRDPAGDPEPGTPEWAQRDADHTACTKQRDNDRRYQPVSNVNSAFYGEDWYRQPVRFDQRRFRFNSFTRLDIPDVPSAEMYRPCPTDIRVCPDLPAGLQRFDPPYPVVVVFHGFIAQKSHHRFNAQVFAEAGYMAISVNGTHIVGSAPNSQRTANGNDVLNWLGSPASGVFGQEADLSRVAFAGHSQGSAAALSYQTDPRVHAIIAWDGGDAASADNCAGDAPDVCTPIMYQRTDGGFNLATSYSNYPSGRDRGLAGYDRLKGRNVDVFHFTARSTVHVDWVGYGSGLGGNRLIEPVTNYYNLAWLDRHLRGKLVFDGNGDVVTSGGRTEAQERAVRQAHAQDAYERLIADTFDDSADRHHVSMGFFDPVKLAQSGDPLWGGNVPYRIEGLKTQDRFSYYYRSFCSISVPDYVNGGTGESGRQPVDEMDEDGNVTVNWTIGAPRDPVPSAARADSTSDGDLRLSGCPEVS